MNKISFLFEGKLEEFDSVGTLTFESIRGIKGESYYCILAYNKAGERRIIDVNTIISITLKLN